MATFHQEARALYQVLAMNPHLEHLPEKIREDAGYAILAAEKRLEELMREHRGYWLGDIVQHGNRGPFLVDSFARREGFENMVVVLRPLKADGTPAKKTVWEYLDTKLTLVAK